MATAENTFAFLFCKRLPKRWLQQTLAALLAMVIAGRSFALDAPWRWTVNVLPGTEFSTEKEAKAALHALGGKYALTEIVEGVNTTETLITYTYGAKPTGPNIGPWYDYTIQYGLTNPHPTEEAAVASVIAWGDQNRQSCTGPTIVVPNGDWYPWSYWSSGHTDMEKRNYGLSFDVHPACDRGNIQIQSWRKRAVACPTHMYWSGATQACELHDIAKISASIRPASHCDDVGNPCSTGDGSKSLVETDLELPWITFRRNYQSQTEVPYAGFGKHWSHSFSARIMSSATGTPQGFLTESGEHLPLRSAVEVIDGSGERVVAAAASGYDKKWLRADGSSKIFQVYGKLLRDDRPDGHWYTYTYDSFNRLVTVTFRRNGAGSFRRNGASVC